MADDFQLVAGHLALDFANTLDYRYDPDRLIDLLPSYERFPCVLPSGRSYFSGTDEQTSGWLECV
jgi:hypothetical protein